MKIFQNAVLTAVFLSFSLTLAAFAGPELNQPAPDFTLKDADGKTHSLKDYRGKTVVLEWTNPQCPFVVRHYKAKTMTTLSAIYGDKGVVWLAVNSSHFNKPEDSKKWARKHKISYPTLQDPSGDVGRKYGAKTTPHMYVIDAEGKLIYKGAIDNDAWGRKRGDKLVNHVDTMLVQITSGQTPEAKETKPYGCSVKYK